MDQKQADSLVRLGRAKHISRELMELDEMANQARIAHTNHRAGGRFVGIDKGKENFYESQLLEDINARRTMLREKLVALG